MVPALARKLGGELSDRSESSSDALGWSAHWPAWWAASTDRAQARWEADHSGHSHGRSRHRVGWWAAHFHESPLPPAS